MDNCSCEMQTTLKTQPIIKFDQVNFNYGNLKVLENISFDIFKGQLTYIIGPNGAGKTSLIKLITKEREVSSGHLSVNSKRIGYLPQSFTHQLKIPITVNEVVYSGFDKQKIFITKNDKEVIDEWLAKVELSGYGNKNINELSGGQRQRVFLARALVADPDLLILDEPTSALDKDYRKSFYELVEKLNKEGITIIIVTHDFDNSFKSNGCVLSIDESIVYYGCIHEYLEERD